jgi:hypothetical protein
MYTLLTPGAIWDYVYVSIDTPPLSGLGLFINPLNTLGSYMDYDSVEIECGAEGAYMPFYLTGDEINQLARSNVGRDPVFMGTDTPDSTTIIPWISVAQGSYFVNGAATTFVATEASLNCATEADVCITLNANNYAYETTGNFVTDGNTVVASTTGATTLITWDENLSMQVLVFIFASSTPTITCGSGAACQTAVVVNPSTLRYMSCRCPERQISLAGGSTLAEIQIFNEDDLLRMTSYTYT